MRGLPSESVEVGHGKGNMTSEEAAAAPGTALSMESVGSTTESVGSTEVDLQKASDNLDGAISDLATDPRLMTFDEMSALGFGKEWEQSHEPKPADEPSPQSPPREVMGDHSNSSLYAGMGSLYEGMTSAPGVLWKGDWKFYYGQVKSICMAAWGIFVAVPLLFFWAALPPLQVRVGVDVTTFGLVLWLLTAVCFFATGCYNPGVPEQPKVTAAGSVPHPGSEYTLSRDSNRYVRGFDHFCEFVGNDIGRGNLGCFVTFLVLLSTLATYVVITSSWEEVQILPCPCHPHFLTQPPAPCTYTLPSPCAHAQVLMWLPPSPPYHILASPLRLTLAVGIIGLVLFALFKCWRSDQCAGVGPLIMLMPGAHIGAILILVVIMATVLLPMVSAIAVTIATCFRGGLSPPFAMCSATAHLALAWHKLI